ncbi:uncharacterized protein LOC127840701 [Dreissena polymorpha]|uniref:uncharacterized protein LOC127840701 n=1 Tax=Dreissena polymorpha TaxID=45954 RepID=UPI0022645E30|nr:uncharacterized protein LOC127840701 [Dreissena polymorpha]
MHVNLAYLVLIFPRAETKDNDVISRHTLAAGVVLRHGVRSVGRGPLFAEIPSVRLQSRALRVPYKLPLWIIHTKRPMLPGVHRRLLGLAMARKVNPHVVRTRWEKE